MILDINESEYKRKWKDIIADGETAVLVFSAEWCGLCHTIINRINEKINDIKVPVLNIDVDENEDLAEDHQIKSLPCIIVYSKGQICERFENNIGIADLLEELTQLT